jgi:hypothetical protein
MTADYVHVAAAVIGVVQYIDVNHEDHRSMHRRDLSF